MHIWTCSEILRPHAPKCRHGTSSALFLQSAADNMHSPSRCHVDRPGAPSPLIARHAKFTTGAVLHRITRCRQTTITITATIIAPRPPAVTSRHQGARSTASLATLHPPSTPRGFMYLPCRYIHTHSLHARAQLPLPLPIPPWHGLSTSGTCQQAHLSIDCSARRHPSRHVAVHAMYVSLPPCLVISVHGPTAI